MPADFAALDSAIADLVVQATATETTEDGATALINTFAAQVTAAVTAALEADNAADTNTVKAAADAVAAVKARFNVSAGKLGDAIATVPGSTPPAARRK